MAAIILGASLFSLPASAVSNLTALPATYDPATKVETLAFKVDGCLTSTLRLYENYKVIKTFPDRIVGDIYYFDFTNYPLGLHTVTAVLNPCGDSATLTFVVPNAGWLPAVIDYVLSY